MAEKKGRRKNIWFAAIIIIVVLIAAYYFSVSSQKPVVVNETVELCNIGDPRYNPGEECQKVIDFKYPDKECKFSFGLVTAVAGGSCTDCIIECR